MKTNSRGILFISSVLIWPVLSNTDHASQQNYSTRTGVVFTRTLSLKLPSIQGCPRMNKVKKNVFHVFKKMWHCFIGCIYVNPLERQKAPMKGKGTALKGEPTVLQRKLQESTVPFVKLMALLSIHRKRERNGHRY